MTIIRYAATTTEGRGTQKKQQIEIKRGEISNLDDEINILMEQLGGVTKKKGRI